MAVDVKVPSVGESVKEGMIHSWKVKTGDYVKRDQVLLELETDKATVEIFAEQSGVIEVQKKVGDTVAVGEVIAKIDTSASAPAGEAPKAQAPAQPTQESKPPVAPTVAPMMAPPPPQSFSTNESLAPSVRRMVEENQINPAAITGTGKDGRVTKGDVVSHLERGAAAPAGSAPAVHYGNRAERRVPMSMIRRRTAERLIQAQTNAAILTTFNEVDMTSVMALRAKYKDSFKEKYGVSLGFMSFFVKASIEALKAFPAINGWIEGNDIVYHDYFDIGVAVSSDRGLMVPVVRDADKMSVSELEIAIGNYGKKARDGKISVDELTGGTFTVSNGGVFGSLMSTPILNPPQSGILGMHKIQERPMVVDGQIVARPMMYLALSYDHRIVDGREAVQFLVKIKDCIEDPARILVGI